MALALRKEEGLGLGIAIAAHVALVAVLLLRPHSAPVVQPPERIQVTISDEVGVTSTSPEPNSQAAPPVSPTLGEPQPQEQAEPSPPEPQPAPPQPAPPRPAPPPPTPRPKPREAELPRPAPRPVPRPAPRVPDRPAPRPRETARPTPSPPAAKVPPQKATPRPAPKAPPQKAPAQKAPAQKASAQRSAAQSPPSKAPAKPRAPAGGSQIGSDFLAGVTGAKSTNHASTSPPAATAGPAVKSALASAISRQLKPRWQAPQGPDAEELVTILSFNLDRNGAIIGTPQVVRQLGITDTNRNQADRHAEQAVKAVRLAAPFNLPPEYYDAWKRVSAFRFDKRLSQ